MTRHWNYLWTAIITFWCMVVASASAQASLNCKIRPPQETAGHWCFIDATRTPVRVWWRANLTPTDQIEADDIRKQIDTVIWDRLTSLMQKAPLPDGGYLLNGGNNRLDIIVDQLGATKESVYLGLTSMLTVPGARPRSPSDRTPTAAFIRISRGMDGDQRRRTLAHEFMHAILLAYIGPATNSEAFYWLSEATATWASQYAYPASGPSAEPLEHDFARDFFSEPGMPLNRVKSDTESYRKYVFLLFLQNLTSRKNPVVIREIWSRAISAENAAAAIDAALPSRIRGVWRDFMIANWNDEKVITQHPYSYGWDNLRDGVYNSSNAKASSRNFELDLAGGPSLQFPMEATLAPLSAAYFHGQVVDADIRAIRFQPRGAMPIARVSQDLHMAVLTKQRGQAWRLLDTSYNARQSLFCQDVSAESVEEFIVILGNSDWRASVPLDMTGERAPRITATNIGCARFSGTTHMVHRHKGSDGVWTSTIDATITLDRVDPTNPGSSPFDENGEFRNRFFANRGTVTWSHVGRKGRCTANAHGSYVLRPDLMATSVLSFNPWFTDEGIARAYHGAIVREVLHPASILVHYKCPPKSGPVAEIVSPVILQVPSYAVIRPDGTLREDRVRFGETTYSWDIRAEREH